jgi:type I restriction enzyme R subunit
MISVNPSRVKFLERYQEIIDKYNREKDRAEIEKAFEELVQFVEDLSREEQRAMREDMTEEYLAVYDLLLKEDLSKKEREKVKQVARELLDHLKTRFLKIIHWTDNPSITSHVRTDIYNKLYELPTDYYPDVELPVLRDKVYQYVYQQYRFVG